MNVKEAEIELRERGLGVAAATASDAGSDRDV
jgi:hypothetical protein